jgi:DNA polymerase/3'-5' exonuclease PolX
MDQLKGYLTEFDSMIGKDHILCIHLNDSKVALGARRDVHQGIGEGYLFGKSPMPEALKVIQELVKFAKGLAIPVILETHSAGSPDKPGGELYAQEIALLTQLVNGNVSGLPKNWRLIHSSKTKKKIITQVQSNKMQSSKTAKNNSTRPVITIAPANIGLINKFIRIKDFYTHVNPDKFRALAYNKAIIALQSYPEEILQGSQVAHLPGVGAKMVEKINEWLTTGNMKIFTEERIDSRFEAWEQSLKDNISHVIGFGPAKVRQLAKRGITTITQLRKAIETDGIKLSPGELVGIKYHEDLMQLVPREEAKDIFDKIYSDLRKSGLLNKYGLRAEIAGSWPSGKAASKDIDILLFTEKYPDADKASKIPISIMTDVEACLRDSGILLSTVSIGAGKLMGIVQGKRGIAHHIDIRLLPSGAEVFGRFYFTSGRVFNQMVRAHAKQQGYKLNEFGLYDLRKAGARVQGLDSEEKIMVHIGMKYIPMNKRR